MDIRTHHALTKYKKFILRVRLLTGSELKRPDPKISYDNGGVEILGLVESYRIHSTRLVLTLAQPTLLPSSTINAY
jgi:hypothetical protein